MRQLIGNIAAYRKAMAEMSQEGHGGISKGHVQAEANSGAEYSEVAMPNFLSFPVCFLFASSYAIVSADVARVGHPMNRLSPRFARPRYSSGEASRRKNEPVSSNPNQPATFLHSEI